MDKSTAAHTNEQARTKTISYSWTIFALPASIFLSGIVLSLALGSLEQQENLYLAKTQVSSTLGNIQTRLESAIRSTFDVTEGIAQLVRLDGDITAAHFQGIAREAISLQPQIKHVVLAPNDIVDNVFPIQANEKFIGVDYRNLADQYGALLRSRENRTSLLAGPVQLIQGGKAFVNRRPVFVTDATGKDQYWGSVSVGADYQKLLLVGGISSINDLQVALRGQDGLGSAGGIIFGDPTLFKEDAVITTVEVPGGTWQLAALPKEGWITNSFYESPMLLFALFCTGFFTYFSAKLIISHQLIEKRQQDLTEETTSRKIIQLSLQQSESRFRALFERSPDPIWIVSLESICVDADAAAIETFGLRSHQKSYRVNPADISPKYQSDGQLSSVKSKEMLDIALAKGAHRFEWLHTRADGSTFPSEVTLCSVILSGQPMVYAVVRDVTVRKTAEEALFTQKSLLLNIVNNAPSLIYVYDTKGNLALCNRMFEKATGFTFAELEGKPRASHMPETQARIFQGNDNEVLSAGAILRFEENITHNGAIHTYLTTKCVLKDGGGFATGVLGISTDITKIKKNTEQLRLAGVVIDHTADGVIITNERGHILSVNNAYTTISGFSAKESIGLRPNILVSENQDNSFYREIIRYLKERGFWQGELWSRRKNGEMYPQWMTINTVYNDSGKITNYVAVFSDFSVINKTKSDLERISHYDPVTGLPNRSLFQKRLQRAIEQTQGGDLILAVIVLDLDDFKTVNDSLGHAQGDMLLQIAAARFQTCIRPSDTVSRLGGDEFAFILGNLATTDEVNLVAEKLLSSLEQPFDLKGASTLITASLGIAIASNESASPEQLLRQADTAMNGKKENGRNGYRFYQAEMTLRAQERMDGERFLRRAVLGQEFEVWYQPKIDIKTNEFVGAEALVRWRDPINGLIPPADFIPLAESTGLIIQIGEQVIDIVCQDIKRWCENGISPGVIAVNVAALQIERSDYVELMNSTLQKYNISANTLEVEVTESLMLASPEHSKAVLHNLQGMGISTAIDDFGTGYSSLAYLKLLPINSLKIDRNFISDLPHDEKDVAITKAIISLGQALGFKIVAEGVENEEQHIFLKEQGCDLGQGYFYSRPMSGAALELWLTQRAMTL